MFVNRQTKNGFTLIEVLIVVAIIGIMSVVTIVSLGNSRQATRLEAAAREVEATIREAQNNALTGKKINAGNSPCKFGWRRLAGNVEYEPYMRQIVSGTCSGTMISLGKKSLKSSVVFHSGITQVQFSLPHAKLEPLSTKQIVLRAPGPPSRFISVCAYTDGRVTHTVVGTTAPPC